MLTGHLRKGTPTTGLNVVLDILPIDLYITGEIAKTRIRLRHRLPRGWNGCGPGPYGKYGHIRLSDFLIDQLNIPDLQTDDAVKNKNFDFNYKVDPSSLEHGFDQPSWDYTCYTDGSKTKAGVGFGAVLYRGP